MPYLKIVLEDLINNLQGDEEIVVVDGGSKDGTVEWLQDLYASKKIQKFYSAKDLGESHGTNRAVLLCEGKILLCNKIRY